MSYAIGMQIAFTVVDEITSKYTSVKNFLESAFLRFLVFKKYAAKELMVVS